MPSYDTYQELARIRASTDASLAYNSMQAGLLSDLSGTMEAIDYEITAVRQTQNQALAVQQTLLQQDAIQGQLEEFIFQSEKLVAECSSAECELPASTRYFLLKGVSEQVKQNGIGTPVIRGRDNKAAFERVIKSVDGLTQKLQLDPEVKQAIAWAKQEEARQRAEQQKLLQANQQAQQQRQKKLQQLEQRYLVLQSRTEGKPHVSWEDFKAWYGRKVTPFVEKYSGPVPNKLVHGVLIVFHGWWWMPLAYGFSAQSKFNKGNAAVLEEMRQIEDEVNNLNAQDAVEGVV